jgi:hypothetical protein
MTEKMRLEEEVQGVAEIVTDLWKQHLGTDPASEPDFMRAGGSSLLLMEIQFGIQKSTGRMIDLEALDLPIHFDSIVKLAGGAEAV